MFCHSLEHLICYLKFLEQFSYIRCLCHNYMFVALDDLTGRWKKNGQTDRQISLGV